MPNPLEQFHEQIHQLISERPTSSDGLILGLLGDAISRYVDSLKADELALDEDVDVEADGDTELVTLTQQDIVHGDIVMPTAGELIIHPVIRATVEDSLEELTDEDDDTQQAILDAQTFNPTAALGVMLGATSHVLKLKELRSGIRVPDPAIERGDLQNSFKQVGQVASLITSTMSLCWALYQFEQRNQERLAVQWVDGSIAPAISSGAALVTAAHSIGLIGGALTGPIGIMTAGGIQLFKAAVDVVAIGREIDFLNLELKKWEKLLVDSDERTKEIERAIREEREFEDAELVADEDLYQITAIARAYNSENIKMQIALLTKRVTTLRQEQLTRRLSALSNGAISSLAAVIALGKVGALVLGSQATAFITATAGAPLILGLIATDILLSGAHKLDRAADSFWDYATTHWLHVYHHPENYSLVKRVLWGCAYSLMIPAAGLSKGISSILRFFGACYENPEAMVRLAYHGAPQRFKALAAFAVGLVAVPLGLARVAIKTVKHVALGTVSIVGMAVLRTISYPFSKWLFKSDFVLSPKAGFIHDMKSLGAKLKDIFDFDSRHKASRELIKYADSKTYDGKTVGAFNAYKMIGDGPESPEQLTQFKHLLKHETSERHVSYARFYSNQRTSAQYSFSNAHLQLNRLEKEYRDKENTTKLPVLLKIKSILSSDDSLGQQFAELLNIRYNKEKVTDEFGTYTPATSLTRSWINKSRLKAAHDDLLCALVGKLKKSDMLDLLKAFSDKYERVGDDGTSKRGASRTQRLEALRLAYQVINTHCQDSMELSTSDGEKIYGAILELENYKSHYGVTKDAMTVDLIDYTIRFLYAELNKMPDLATTLAAYVPDSTQYQSYLDRPLPSAPPTRSGSLSDDHTMEVEMVSMHAFTDEEELPQTLAGKPVDSENAVSRMKSSTSGSQSVSRRHTDLNQRDDSHHPRRH